MVVLCLYNSPLVHVGSTLYWSVGKGSQLSENSQVKPQGYFMQNSEK